MPVRGPEILKLICATSGHYACYGENKVSTEIDGQEYGIKPYELYRAYSDI